MEREFAPSPFLSLRFGDDLSADNASSKPSKKFLF